MLKYFLTARFSCLFVEFNTAPGKSSDVSGTREVGRGWNHGSCKGRARLSLQARGPVLVSPSAFMQNQGL